MFPSASPASAESSDSASIIQRSDHSQSGGSRSGVLIFPSSEKRDIQLSEHERLVLLQDMIVYYKERIDAFDPAKRVQSNGDFKILSEEHNACMSIMIQYLARHPQCEPALQKTLYQCLDSQAIKALPKNLQDSYATVPLKPPYTLRFESIKRMMDSCQSSPYKSLSLNEILCIEQYFLDYQFFQTEELMNPIVKPDPQLLWVRWMKYSIQRYRAKDSRTDVRHMMEIGLKTPVFSERHLRLKYVLQMLTMPRAMMGVIVAFFFKEHTGHTLSDALKTELSDLVHVAKRKKQAIIDIMQTTRQVKAEISAWIVHSESHWSGGWMDPIQVAQSYKAPTAAAKVVTAGKTVAEAGICTKWAIPRILSAGARTYLRINVHSPFASRLWVNATQVIFFNAKAAPLLGPISTAYSVAKIAYNQADRITYSVHQWKHQRSPYEKVLEHCHQYCSKNLYRWIEKKTTQEQVAKEFDEAVHAMQREMGGIFFQCKIGNGGMPVAPFNECEGGGKIMELQTMVTCFQTTYGTDTPIQTQIESVWHKPR